MTSLENFNLSRPLDDLGRICIPKETRQMLDWNEKDQIFIGVKNGIVYMRKFAKVCPICRNPFDNDKGLNVCNDCIDNEIRVLNLE